MEIAGVMEYACCVSDDGGVCSAYFGVCHRGQDDVFRVWRSHRERVSLVCRVVEVDDECVPSVIVMAEKP